jgi:pyruvate dehydrogenase E2 component (dihydrolipoamide acetyltransferase)
MPKQGQSVESCILLAWLKKKGDIVNKGDILFSYETDKASFEFESPVQGVLLETFFKEQDEVPVLSNVAVIGEPGESTVGFEPESSLSAEVNSNIGSVKTADLPEVITSTVTGNSEYLIKDSEQKGVSPRAKKTAMDRGVEVSTLRGTGPGGRVIERDVLAATPLTKSAIVRKNMENLLTPAQGTGPGGRIRSEDLVAPSSTLPETLVEDLITEVKISSMRRIIATRMMQSLQQSAQLTMTAYADATALLAFRKRIKARGKDLNLPDITVTDLIAFAVAKTLPSFAEINSIRKDDKIMQYKHVHLAVAVDTSRGLMVPVVRFADLLSLGALSTSLKTLAAQCRDGAINPDLLAGGTITITNLGMFGIESFTPILNIPQVAILGVNTITSRPVQNEDGTCQMRPHIGLSLTIDHQAVDGAPGARFLKALCENIADIDFLVSVW